MIALKKDDLTEGFEIEPNTLINDDCLNAMKFIPDNSISMILTDPPYGTTACKWDSIIPLTWHIIEKSKILYLHEALIAGYSLAYFEEKKAPGMWEQLKRIIKPNGAIVMTASQPFTSILVFSNLGWFKYEWIWEKPKATGHLNSKKRPMVAHESVLVFYSKQSEYNPQKVKGESYGTANRKEYFGGVYSKAGGHREGNLSGMRYPRSVQVFSAPHHPSHPTQKPVALMEYLIKTYTNEGEAVLDFTMGSGTTGVACKNLNRKFIGIEMDCGYFEIAKNRIEES